MSGAGGGGGARLEVVWTGPDRFVSWGADISLYELAPGPDPVRRPTGIKLSDRTSAYLVASHSNCQYVRCLDVCSAPQEEPLLALGHANGKVLLASFGHGGDLPFAAGGRELVPRHARQCNSVAWNRTEHSVLAAALDKYRNDHCILLWDVNKCNAGDGSSSPRINNGMSLSWQGQSISAATAGVELPRPIAEMGLSEMAHSLAWTHASSRVLLASMNQKHIKIFDLRDFSNKAVTVTSTKYCYGVCVDPYNEWQMASRADSTICVWDTRQPEKPLLTLAQPKPVTKILWCPTRRNLLGSLQRDSCSLRLHDLQQAHDAQPAPCTNEDSPNNESGTCVLERNVSPGCPHSITGFSWHPADQARLLAIAVSGTIMEYTVCERMTVSWGGGSGQLVWSHGGRALHAMPEQFYDSLDDISHKIKRRTQSDYGLKSELWQNADLAEDESLKHLWNWLYLSKSLVEEGCIRGTQWRHPGVRAALKMEGGGGGAGYRSETVASPLADFGSLHNTTYKSPERTRALQLCGWGWESVTLALERLEAEGSSLARAAALAVFHLRLKTAVDMLSRAPQQNLRMVALALAGYSEERGVWRDLASVLLSTKLSLNDPYLRVIFAFLTSDDTDYKDVLNESEVRVEDRVAFACIFLDDGRLQEYVNTLTDQLTERGLLAGILLTGMSTEGITLLQRWLENTGDVQSAALLAARSFTADMLRDLRVQDWIASYRLLLDGWRVWWSRCALDTCLGSSGGQASAAGATSRPPQQVYISCNFCGKTVSAPHTLARVRTTFARIAPAANKMKQISACPNCRKPLPRCAVCLMHMGTASSGPGATTPGSGGAGPGGGAEFPGWFTWCVACRHGGHAKHLLQWFEEHLECPVSSCTCRCLNMDLPNQLL